MISSDAVLTWRTMGQNVFPGLVQGKRGALERPHAGWLEGGQCKGVSVIMMAETSRVDSFTSDSCAYLSCKEPPAQFAQADHVQIPSDDKHDLTQTCEKACMDIHDSLRAFVHPRMKLQLSNVSGLMLIFHDVQLHGFVPGLATRHHKLTSHSYCSYFPSHYQPRPPWTCNRMS